MSQPDLSHSSDIICSDRMDNGRRHIGRSGAQYVKDAFLRSDPRARFFNIEIMGLVPLLHERVRFPRLMRVARLPISHNVYALALAAGLVPVAVQRNGEQFKAALR